MGGPLARSNPSNPDKAVTDGRDPTSPEAENHVEEMETVIQLTGKNAPNSCIILALNDSLNDDKDIGLHNIKPYNICHHKIRIILSWILQC